MRIPVLLIITAALVSCGKPQGAPVTGEPLPPLDEVPLTLASMEGRTVEDLLVLVFREDLVAEDWTDVFTKAARFTRLRGESRRLSRQDTALHSSVISANALETARILYDLYVNDTAYFIDITAAQGCRFTGGALACAAEAAANPDFPRFPGVVAVERVRRNGRVSPPALVLNLVAAGEAALRLELVPEANGGETVFKGQVIVGPGARFERQDLPIPHYPIGYAELRLSPDVIN